MIVKADDIKFDIAYLKSGYDSEAMEFNIPWREFVNGMIKSEYSHKDVQSFPAFVPGKFKGEEEYTSRKAADLIHRSMFVMNIVRCPVEKFERMVKLLEAGKSLRALGRAKCLILSSEYNLMAYEKDAVPNARFRIIIPSARVVLPDRYKAVAKHLVTEIEKSLEVSIDPASWHTPSQAWRCQMHKHKGECYTFESSYEMLFDPDSVR